MLAITAILMVNPFMPAAKKYSNPPVIVHETEQEARDAAASESGASKGQYYRMTGSSSMEPLITGRVYVSTAPKAFDKIAEGDIGAYRAQWFNNGGVVVHRLVSKYGDGSWIASGDNNRNSERTTPVKKDNYIGVVTTIHTFKGAENTRSVK